MVVVTPGIDFIAHHLVTFSVLSSLLALSLRALRTTYGFPIPTWALVCGVVTFVPLMSVARIMYTSFDNERRAAVLGARLAPTIKGESIGNLDVLLKMMRRRHSGYPGDELTEAFGDIGPFANIRVMWSDMVCTTCPEHIKLILSTDFDNYVKGKQFHGSMFSVLGSSIFTSDGDDWRHHRSMSRPFFVRDRSGDFELYDRHADTVLSLIKKRMGTGYGIDFQDLMCRFTLDSASEFLLGHCVNSLDDDLPYPHNARDTPQMAQSSQFSRADEFSRAFLEAQEVISTRERYRWLWPLREIFEDKSKKPMKNISAYLDPIIQPAIAKEEKKGEPHADEGDALIDHLVGSSSDPAVLKAEILSFMVASRDTTAAVLTFIIYALAMYPAVSERLREEVLATVGPTRRPDYDNIKRLKYLRAVINETLRLFPVVPINLRQAVKATIWPSPNPTQKPIYIPAGTRVPYSVFLMHRRKDLWGLDAEEFDPDRFLDDRLHNYLLKNPFIFLPFNAGPRICPGKQFAYNQISFLLIRLLQQFSSISLDEAATPPEARPPAHWADGIGRKAIEKVYPKSHLTLYANGGLWVRMGRDDSQ